VTLLFSLFPVLVLFDKERTRCSLSFSPQVVPIPLIFILVFSFSDSFRSSSGYFIGILFLDLMSKLGKWCRPLPRSVKRD